MAKVNVITQVALTHVSGVRSRGVDTDLDQYEITDFTVGGKLLYIVTMLTQDLFDHCCRTVSSAYPYYFLDMRRFRIGIGK